MDRNRGNTQEDTGLLDGTTPCGTKQVQKDMHEGKSRHSKTMQSWMLEETEKTTALSRIMVPVTATPTIITFIYAVPTADVLAVPTPIGTVLVVFMPKSTANNSSLGLGSVINLCLG